MSNESKLKHLLVDTTDTVNKVSRSVSAIEIGNGVLIITTTKQLDPVSNTYRIVTESTSFVLSSSLSLDEYENEYKVVPRY